MAEAARGAEPESEPGAPAGPWLAPGRLTRYLYELRTEGQGRGRQAAAIGLGVFIGCTPFYGAHFWICLAVGWLLRLNRLKLYLAANVSNPFFAPFIVFSEVQAGSLLRRGAPYPLSMAAFRELDPWHFAGDLLLGSLVVGGILGALAAVATWSVAEARLDPRDEGLVADAAARYLGSGIPTWEFANGKLRFDPVYLDVLRRVPLPDEGRVLDLGCGRGLMLALLAAHYRSFGPGALSRVRLHGIEYRPRMVKIARRALGEAAVIDQADLTVAQLPPCQVATLFDVLHCLPEPVQEALLARLRDAVAPGGYLVVREADEGEGWRASAVEVCNRTVAILQGRWRRQFHFRDERGWAGLLARFGFSVETPPRDGVAKTANVLLWARRTDG